MVFHIFGVLGIAVFCVETWPSDKKNLYLQPIVTHFKGAWKQQHIKAIRHIERIWPRPNGTRMSFSTNWA